MASAGITGREALAAPSHAATDCGNSRAMARGIWALDIETRSELSGGEPWCFTWAWLGLGCRRAQLRRNLASAVQAAAYVAASGLSKPCQSLCSAVLRPVCDVHPEADFDSTVSHIQLEKVPASTERAFPSLLGHTLAQP